MAGMKGGANNGKDEYCVAGAQGLRDVLLPTLPWLRLRLHNLRKPANSCSFKGRVGKVDV